MSEAVQNRYIADLRDFRFLLFEQFNISELLGKPPYDAWGPDEVNMVIDEAYKFSCEVFGPLNAIGDRYGCKLEGGSVITPPGFKEAWRQLYEAGWPSLNVHPEWGGQGAPFTLGVVTQEMMSGANPALNMYPGLTNGAAEVIEAFGTDHQKETYLRNLYSGKWGGTMCLTEPQAGSDVGSSKSTAKKLPDGRYAIRGTKIFISSGDQDLTENVIHLVLARVDNAPAGTKGLSLFIVPKLRFTEDGSLTGSNDVAVGSIEHKMGICGSSTCVLNFGDTDSCIGELVGTVENAGMSQMFRMMNGARIGVGLLGVGVASTAYLNALVYAKDRKQGASIQQWKDPSAPRVSIVEHPDVRRMLLDMKSRVEGMRALIVMLAYHHDNYVRYHGNDEKLATYHQGQVDLLVPLVKAYSSDQAFRICETAIQTLGGAGYTRDYPIEQCCRDSKIFSIYEGTNHIQAMDLVGRKLAQAGGANLQSFIGRVAAFASANENHPVLGAEAKELNLAQQIVGETAMRFMMWFQTGKMVMVPLAANRFLEMMSEVAVAWLLLEGAKIAVERLADTSISAADRAFYEGKKQAALYYARNVLPNVRQSASILSKEDTSAIDIPLEAFASV